MRGPALKWVGAVFAGVALFFAGWAVGRVGGEGPAEERLEREVAGVLSLHVLALGKLRGGSAEEAIRLLEESAQQAVITLPRDRPIEQLGEDSLRPLQMTKAYFECHGADLRPEVERIFAGLPDPPQSFCDPARADGSGGPGADPVPPPD